MSVPQQKRGKSKQDYATPLDLITAVESRFGTLSWDLAADALNRKAPLWIDEAQNSLTVDWHKLDGLLWLNPPFSNIEVWARKCKEEAKKGARILLLTPASVGSNWFLNYIHGWAEPFALNPRIKFIGCDHQYPKDLMITYFRNVPAPLNVWKWKLETVNQKLAA